MALKNLKMTLKKGLKAQIHEEEEKGSGGKNDPRFLNYYDMKFDEKMTVLFVPDAEGRFWAKYKMHGPGLRLRGAGAVRCIYDAVGESCPACQKGFDLLDLYRETNDDSYKEEAKRWFSKDATVISCIVLDAPMDVAATEDGNQVKLFRLPFNIEKHIKECIKEGRITEDQLCTTPFVIKKTKGTGGPKDNPNASYEHSYFLHGKEVTEEELSYLDDMVVEQFNYEDGGDVVPAIGSIEEIEEWLEKAEALDEKSSKEKAKGGRSSKAADGDSRADAIRERALQSRRTQEEDEDSDEEQEESSDADNSTPEPESKPVSDARDRLARFRNRG